MGQLSMLGVINPEVIHLSKNERKEYKEQNLTMLKQSGIKFECFDENSIHIRVMDEWDVWPSTCRCKNIFTNETFFGVQVLLKRLGFR